MTRIRKLPGMLCAAAAALMLSAAPLAAQEVAPETLDLARQYVELTDSSKIFEVTLVQTGIDTMKTLLPQNPEIEEQLNTAIGDTIKQMKDQKSDLIDQFARLYAARFSTEELQTIVDFYSSDVGKKLVKANFEANEQIRKILALFKQNLSKEFMAKVRANLKDQGIDL